MNRRNIDSAIALVSVLAILGAGSVRAEDAGHGESGHGAAHGYHSHILGLFVGGATEELGRRENGVALGIEYEYRLGPGFGIGAILEHTYGDLDTWVYALPFAFHSGRWKLYAAPGIEEGEEGSERMLRLGVEYGFHLDNWEISPQVDLDLIEGNRDVFVIGLTFARGFDW